MALADRRTAITDVQNALLYTEYFYVDSVKSDKLAEDAIRGMLKALDPHSTYLTRDEVKHMNEGLGGNFEGIGVRYQMEKDTLLVISTVVGGPSEKQGILAGDHIVAVNDTSVYSVDASYMATPDVGYIRIARFAQTTPFEVEDAMRKLSKEGMKNLIIDLQGNGGGYLESAVQLASLFLEKGQMIVYTSGRREPKRVHNATREDAFKGRLVVLIDEESASSSEIFTGAIQDWDRGVIVGRRSFGKGLVQRPIELPSGAMIRLTIARYFTPSGRCIQKPFTKGEGDNYHRDLLTRYKKGEFVSADSIHLDDSLMYSTFGKRIVYGGGGIMPDVFVPLDTTKITKTHRDLMAKGTINRWILAYFKENQKSLHASYESFESFNKGFNISDADIKNLCEMGKKDNINIDANDMEKSDYLLKLQLKAYLANDLYEQGAYNRIMNQRVPAFKEAVSIISDEERYYKYLTTATSEVAKQ